MKARRTDEAEATLGLIDFRNEARAEIGQARLARAAAAEEEEQ
jgi:hypothetical protein